MTNSPSISQITHKDIVKGLRKLGLTQGMGVMVHSSLKSFGFVKGGAQTVIKALMEVVTSEGTLMMPSFNHGVPFKEGGIGYYSPIETPTINGIIPDTFWRMQGVYRSLNPTHPFAAWGKNAQRYIKFHHRTLTMGPQSPMGLLYADGGFGLLVGVDYRVNTFHHVVEMSVGAPCLGLRTEAYPVLLPDGRKVEGRTWGWREKSCPFTDSNRYGEEMKLRGLQKEIFIGNSRVILFKLSDCFKIIADFLKNGRDGFPPCKDCPVRPKYTSHTVPSDWNKEKQCLLSDLVAWTY